MFWYVFILIKHHSNQPSGNRLILSLFFFLQGHFVHLNILFMCFCVCCRISEGAYVQAWWRLLQCLWEEWWVWKHLVGKPADSTCDFCFWYRHHRQGWAIWEETNLTFFGVMAVYTYSYQLSIINFHTSLHVLKRKKFKMVFLTETISYVQYEQISFCRHVSGAIFLKV